MKIGSEKELSYEEAVTLIKQKFETFRFGEFKPWCNEHGINHKTLSSILNDNLPNPSPGIICKILEKLGYTATMEKKIVFKIIKNPQ